MIHLQKTKPTTPSKRHLIKINNKSLGLSKSSLLKNRLITLKASSGKNNSGRITVRHKGGGVKKRYRKIDFSRNQNSIGIICSLEYDPYRNSQIASVFNFIQKSFFYILLPKNLKVGDIVKSGTDIPVSVGSSLPLESIPVGTVIHNVSMTPGNLGTIARAAGTSCVIQEKSNLDALLKLASDQTKKVKLDCFATVGEVSNGFHFLTKLGKAGRNRWKNVRPTVRGVAMNPIDHPHGGGEGKKSGIAKTPWGKSMQK